MHAKIQAAVAAIRARHAERPLVGFILGSGLGSYADTFENATVIPYHDLPDFPHSTVLGHAGKMILGDAGNTPVVALQGRVHFYEGYSMNQVVFPRACWAPSESGNWL